MLSTIILLIHMPQWQTYHETLALFICIVIYTYHFILIPALWPFRCHAPCSLNFFTPFSLLPKPPMQSLLSEYTYSLLRICGVCVLLMPCLSEQMGLNNIFFYSWVLEIILECPEHALSCSYQASTYSMRATVCTDGWTVSTGAFHLPSGQCERKSSSSISPPPLPLYPCVWYADGC